MLPAMLQLPDAARTLSKSDVYKNTTVTTTWLDHITPLRTRQQDADNHVLGHLRMLVMPGAWHSDGFAVEPFVSAAEAIVSPDDAGRPNTVKAGRVLAVFRKPGVVVIERMHPYVACEHILDEIVRVGESEETARLQPLFLHERVALHRR